MATSPGQETPNRFPTLFAPHPTVIRLEKSFQRGKKTGCKYRCASHPSTGSRRPYDLEETRLPGMMRKEIQEHQHAGLSQEELQGRQRINAWSQQPIYSRGTEPGHQRAFADQCGLSLWEEKGPQGWGAESKDKHI